jgi:hypothetical protein
MSPRVIRTLLHESVDLDEDMTGEDLANEMSFPGEANLAEAILRSGPEGKRQRELLAPIAEHAGGSIGAMKLRVFNDALRTPTDAERHAAPAQC